MIEYSFICPKCGEQAQLVEKAIMEMHSPVIGFYNLGGGVFPECDAVNKEYYVPAEDFPVDDVYICSECGEELWDDYNTLYKFVVANSGEENAGV